jgi:hypothetical protein
MPPISSLFSYLKLEQNKKYYCYSLIENITNATAQDATPPMARGRKNIILQ